MNRAIGGIAAICLVTLTAFRMPVALTGGPLQPEYQSFEPVDVTDLVNLPTGDFTYVLPLGSVRDPAGVGYPLVLSYHAGVQLEQEATWVGLGWSLNVGSINRMVRGFPDDYRGDYTVAHLHDLGKRGWNLNVGGGWTAFSATVGWNEKGFVGVTSVGLSGSYGPLSGGLSVDPQQETVTASGGIGISGNRGGTGSVGLSVTLGDAQPTVGFYGGVGAEGHSVAGFGLNSRGAVGVTVAGNSLGRGTAVSKEGLTQWSGGAGIMLPLPFGFRLDASASIWGWHYSQMTIGRAYGYLYQSSGLDEKVQTYNDVLVHILGLESAIERPSLWALSKARVDQAQPTDPTETYVNLAFDKLEYLRQGEYSLPAQDMYTVSGQGIGGVFKPYVHRSPVTVYSEVQEGDEEDYDGLIGRIADDGRTTEGYFNTSPMHISPWLHSGMSFRMVSEAALNLIDDPVATCSYDDRPDDDNGSVDDYRNIHRVGSANDAGHVAGTRITPIFTSDTDEARKLAGFAVTDQEGKTYLYSQPLHVLQQVSYVSSSPQPPGTFATDCNCSYKEELGIYASSWLLTAVTGPDYIKMSLDSDGGQEEALLPHDGDLGYWATFRYMYGREGEDEVTGDTTVATMLFREPYYDSETPAPKPHKTNPAWADRYSSSFGMKEITYLHSVETASEIAFFITGEREDAMGPDKGSYPDFARYAFTTTQDPQSIQMKGGTSWRTLAKTGWLLGDFFSEEDGELNEYSQVRVPASKFSAGDFWDVEEGTPIGAITFETTCTYRYDKGVWNASRQRLRRPSFLLVKDTYRCTTPSGTPPGEGDPPTHISNLLPYSRFGRSRHNNYCLEGACRSIAELKCFYAERQGEDVVLYIIPYRRVRLDSYGVVPLYSMLKVPSFIWAKNRKFELTSVARPMPVAGYLNGLLHRHWSRNPITRNSKSLESIEWYSKAEYPYLVPDAPPSAPDMAQRYAEDGLQLPQWYKRTRFGYTYDLAKNTPNSKAPNGAGRLTLKEVRMEAGPPSASQSMPPYLFEYQGQDIPYPGYDEGDGWGMHTRGPTWNLTGIQFPSGGRLDIEYERDQIQESIEGALYGISRSMPALSIGPAPEEYAAPSDPITAWRDDDKKHLTFVVSWTSDELPSLDIGDELLVQEISGGNELHGVFVIRDLEFVDETQGVLRLELDRPLNWIGDPPLFSSNVGFQVLKSVAATGGDLRVSKVTQRTGIRAAVTRYDYAASGGTVGALPLTAVPAFLTQVPNTPNAGYSTGNTSVIYPWVEVSTVKAGTPADQSPNGSIRYHFYTENENVTVGGEDVPLIQYSRFGGTYDGEQADVHKIIDRSALIGQVKKVEHLNASGEPLKTITNHYAFSEDVASVAGVRSSSFDNSVTDEAPLGMVRERCVRFEHFNESGEHQYPVKSISDVIISKPFLVKVVEETDGVIQETRMGWFDARTAQPLITATTQKGLSGNAKRVHLEAPTGYLLCASGNTSALEIIEEKNTYKLAGAGLTVNIAHKLGTGPEQVDHLGGLTYSDIVSVPESVKVAQAQFYMNIPGPVSAAVTGQNRLALQKTVKLRDYSLTDGQGNTIFQWPAPDNIPSNWLVTSAIERVDRYTRANTEMNGMDEPTTAVHHPRQSAVIGIIRNGMFRECAVYTCNYQESEDRDYLDKDNGWARGERDSEGNGNDPDVLGSPLVVLDDQEKHFGHKSLYVLNAFGPTRNFKLEKDQDGNYKDYIVSAWIKMGTEQGSEQLKIYADLRPVKEGVTPGWPVKCCGADGDLDPPLQDVGGTINYERVVTGADASDWTYFELELEISKLPSSVFPVPERDVYARVFIGNGDTDFDAHMDDIRIYPKDALVKSFYYDQELGVPVAFVDENNKAKYFEYDGFGRLIKRRNNAGKLVSEAEYGMGAPKDGVLLIGPGGGDAAYGIPPDRFWVWGTWPIRWYSYGAFKDVSTVKIEYSPDAGKTWFPIADPPTAPNTGRYDWHISSNIAPSDHYRIRISDIQDEDLFVESQGDFSVRLGRGFTRRIE